MSQTTAEKGPAVLILLPRGAPPSWRELADEIRGWLEEGSGPPKGSGAVVELSVQRGSPRRDLARATRSIADAAVRADLALILGEDWLPLRAAAILGASELPCLCLPVQGPAQRGDAGRPQAPGPSAAAGRALESLLANRALGEVVRLDPALPPKEHARMLAERASAVGQSPPSSGTPPDEDWLAIAEHAFEAHRRLADWGVDLVQHSRDLESKSWFAQRLGFVRRRVRRFLRKRGWI